jgi:hypothetical protein
VTESRGDDRHETAEEAQRMMRRALLLTVLLLPACAGWKSDSMTKPMPQDSGAGQAINEIGSFLTNRR